MPGELIELDIFRGRPAPFAVVGARCAKAGSVDLGYWQRALKTHEMSLEDGCRLLGALGYHALRYQLGELDRLTANQTLSLRALTALQHATVAECAPRPP